MSKYIDLSGIECHDYRFKSKQEQTGQINLDLLFKLSNSGLTLARLGIWYR